MYKHLYTTLFVLCCIYTSNAQTRDFPEFPNPQNDFYILLEENKVTNPKYLEGSVREVNRTYTEHISPDNDEVYTADYYYRLKKDKEITAYTTSDIYDDTTIPYLNEALQPSPKNDTIIKDDFYTYIYNKGKLTHYISYDISGGTMDSIVYTYKKEHLLTRTQYRSQGAIDVDFSDNGEVDEYILFPEFEIYAYAEATYNKIGLIQTVVQYQFTEEEGLVDSYHYNYMYDIEGRFKNLQAISDRVFLTYKQQKKHPKNWKLATNEVVEGMYLETTINTTYDTKNRIQTYIKTDSNKNKESYSVAYDGHSNKKITVSRDDYSFQYDTTVHRDLLYEYMYDTYQNPTYITSYIIVNGKKVLDKSTTLKITYY